MDDQIPSTHVANTGVSDETLENFAQALKLTKNNVKQIIYHIITDEELYATLLGHDKQKAPYLKLTRSKWKDIQNSVKAKLDLELRTVSPVQTFLTEEYNEDDDDPDYMPARSPAADKRDLRNFERYWSPEQEPGPFCFDQLNCRDEAYHQFVCDTIDGNIYPDDDNDNEYDVLNDLENVNDDDFDLEYRNDRTTKISKDEMADLWKDFEIDIRSRDLNLSPPLPSPQKRAESRADVQSRARIFLDNSEPDEPIDLSLRSPQKSTASETPAFPASADESEPTSSTLTEAVPVSSKRKVASCSLMQRPLKITHKEWTLLKDQAEMLVQLLTQTCIKLDRKENNDDKALYNRSARCITALVDEARKDNPLFKDTAIEDACDLVFDYHENLPKIVNVPSFAYLSNLCHTDTNDFPHCIKYAVSVSKVFKFPDLLMEGKKTDQKKDFFLSGEQMLLALGLKYFENVPLARHMSEYGKYQRIHQYLLPSKTCLQMRVHLKNLKNANNVYESKVKKVLLSALNNEWDPDEAPIGFAFIKRQDLPVDWPKQHQPAWLQRMATSRVYRKYGDCILASFLVRDGKLVTAKSWPLGGNYFNFVTLPLERESDIPLERLIKNPEDAAVNLTTVLNTIPDITQTVEQ